MKSRNKIVRQYLRQVRKAVPCSGKERRQLVQQLEESVAQYVSEHGAETVDDISREFGSPGEIWEAFLQNKDAAYIQRQLALKNRICRIVIVMAAVLVIIVAILGTLRLIDWYQFTHGYVVETARGSCTTLSTIVYPRICGGNHIYGFCALL